MNADGVIFNNVYDNGYSNNQVIFSLRDDLKNGRVFKKGAKPLEKSQFIDTGTSMNGDLDINKNIQNFVEYLLNPETQQRIASIDAELGTKYGEAAKRFVKRIMKEHPEYNEVSVRNKYKYLTIPSEFNSQLHPLIEFEQRAGKSGVPNFKSVDEIDRLINNNPYVGTSEQI